MRKPSLAIGLLVVSLLLSAWGNVIAACFCPRYGLNSNSCLTQATHESTQVKHESSCHDAMPNMMMNGMSMDDMYIESQVMSESPVDLITGNSEIHLAAEDSNERVALDLPIEPCGHCWMHSQPASGTATLVAVDPSRQLIGTDAPIANSTVTVPNAFTVSITPQEHGPPGNLLPRHVLINVFRI